MPPRKLLNAPPNHTPLTTPFAAQCSMCYNSTVNLAFILDPNDCQKYYICVPRSQGGYDAYNMACADCQFWDNDKLTCVEVDQSCRTNPSVPTGTPLPRC